MTSSEAQVPIPSPPPPVPQSVACQGEALAQLRGWDAAPRWALTPEDQCPHIKERRRDVAGEATWCEGLVKRRRRRPRTHEPLREAWIPPCLQPSACPHLDFTSYS